MPLFGPPDIGKLKRKGKVKALAKALGHESRALRLDAARALEEVGDKRAVPALLAALDRGKRDREMAKALSRALAHTGDPLGADPIAELLPAPFAAEALADLGVRRALPPLERALKQADSEVEARALAGALAALNWKPAGGALSTKYYLALQDDPEEESWKALEAQGKPAVEPIISWVKSRTRDLGPAKPASVARAILALGRIGARDGLAFVVRLLGDLRSSSPAVPDAEESAREFSAAIREAALGALSRPHPDALANRRIGGEFVQLLLRGELAEGETEEFSALFTRIGYPAPLIECLYDNDLDNRMKGARVLERLGWEPPEDDDDLCLAFWAGRGWWNRVADAREKGVPVLVQWIEEDGEPREGPFEALLDMGEAAIQPLLAELDEDFPHAFVADAAVRLGASRGIEVLLEIGLNHHRHWRFAAERLLELDDPRGCDVLFESARSGIGDWRYAADRLVELGDPRGADALLEVARSECPDRLEAARALAALGDSRALEPLGAMAKDGSVEAIRALGDTGDPEAAGHLTALLDYRPPGEAPDYEDDPHGRVHYESREDAVRTAAATALAKLGEPRGFEWLRSSVLEGAGKAIVALGKVGGEKAIESLRSAADDLDYRRFYRLTPMSRQELEEKEGRVMARIKEELVKLEDSGRSGVVEGS